MLKRSFDSAGFTKVQSLRLKWAFRVELSPWEQDDSHVYFTLIEQGHEEVRFFLEARDTIFTHRSQ